jgi:hypothetical protein
MATSNNSTKDFSNSTLLCGKASKTWVSKCHRNCTNQNKQCIYLWPRKLLYCHLAHKNLATNCFTLEEWPYLRVVLFHTQVFQIQKDSASFENKNLPNLILWKSMILGATLAEYHSNWQVNCDWVYIFFSQARATRPFFVRPSMSHLRFEVSLTKIPCTRSQVPKHKHMLSACNGRWKQPSKNWQQVAP